MHEQKHVLVCVLSQQTRCEEQEQVKSRTFLPVFSPCGVGPAAIVTSCYGRDSPVSRP